MDNYSQLKNILPQISSIVPKYCDKCGAKHAENDLSVMDQNGGRLLCKLQCKNCKNTYLIHVNRDPDGLVTRRAQVKPEISTQQEYQKFADIDAIDQEEILDVFMALEEVDSMADLEALLRDE